MIVVSISISENGNYAEFNVFNRFQSFSLWFIITFNLEENMKGMIKVKTKGIFSHVICILNNNVTYFDKN